MQIGSYSYTPRYSMPLENRNRISGTSKASGTDKAPVGEDFSSHFSASDGVTVTKTASGAVRYGR